jgi:hypothetical protein
MQRLRSQGAAKRTHAVGCIPVIGWLSRCSDGRPLRGAVVSADLPQHTAARTAGFPQTQYLASSQ